MTNKGGKTIVKKIAYVSTARSDYNPSRQTLKAIHEDPEFELTVWAGGSHFSKDHGFTLEEIEHDKIDYECAGYFNAISLPETCHSITRTFEACFELMEINKPDLLLINGDRTELIPYIYAAFLYNVPIAHIGGGEITEGSLDNITRWVISRYAHLHLVSEDKYADNLRRAGEEPWRIHVVGHEGMENALKTEPYSLEDTSAYIGLDLNNPTGICIYYPSIEDISIEEQIKAVLGGIEASEMQTVFILPCEEPGAEIINKAIKNYCEPRKHCRWFSNLNNKTFVSLMRYSACMIGNSSCGLLEYPVFGKPVINTGRRQNGRKEYDNTWNCRYKPDDIWLFLSVIKNNPGKFGCLPSDELKIDTSAKVLQAIKQNINRPDLLHKKFIFN